MNKISLEDLAAIVNFFKGEGCINICRNTNRFDGHYVLNISITNTNKEKLNWIKKILGVGQIELHAKETIKSKKSWQFDLAVHEMTDFLDLLINSKYLIIKKYQTLIMLEWLKKITNCISRKGFDFGSKDKKICISEIVIREIIFENMKLLNKRGPYTKEELIELEKIKQYYDWWYQENYPHLQKIK